MHKAFQSTLGLQSNVGLQRWLNDDHSVRLLFTKMMLPMMQLHTPPWRSASVDGCGDSEA